MAVHLNPDSLPNLLASIEQSKQNETTATEQLASSRSVNQPADNPAAAASLVRNHDRAIQDASFLQNIGNLQGRFQLADSALSNVVQVLTRAVSLREMGFYESGSSTMRPSAMDAVDRQASVITPRSESLRIEGHTDNVPIHNAHYPSNWELSTARATDLVQLFILRYHVMPSRLSAAGYTEFHPIDDNSTPEGRSHNRCIDIVILNPVLTDRSPILSQGPAVNPLSGPASSEPVPSPGASPQGP